MATPPVGDIGQHHRIGANSRMFTNVHATQHLGAGPQVHMAIDPGQAIQAARTDGDLLKDQAIGADETASG